MMKHTQETIIAIWQGLKVKAEAGDTKAANLLHKVSPVDHKIKCILDGHREPNYIREVA